MKKELIAATGISLAVLLTTNFADEAEFTQAVFANEEVTSTEEYKRIYKKESAECSQKTHDLEIQMCNFEAKEKTLRQIRR